MLFIQAELRANIAPTGKQMTTNSLLQKYAAELTSWAACLRASGNLVGAIKCTQIAWKYEAMLVESRDVLIIHEEDTEVIS
ncbi:MAG: hypothetical protein NVS2B14_20510 [Chamaesiphon sp.]